MHLYDLVILSLVPINTNINTIPKKLTIVKLINLLEYYMCGESSTWCSKWNKKQDKALRYWYEAIHRQLPGEWYARMSKFMRMLKWSVANRLARSFVWIFISNELPTSLLWVFSWCSVCAHFFTNGNHLFIFRDLVAWMLSFLHAFFCLFCEVMVNKRWI